MTAPTAGEAAGQGADKAALLQAFQVFEQASAALKEEYAQLRSEVARLRKEVEEKNVLLERGMEEHRRWRLFLTEVLERLPVGVVVCDAAARLVAGNGHAVRLLGLPAPPPPGVPLSGLGETGRIVAEAAGVDGARIVAWEGQGGGTTRLEITRTSLSGSSAAADGFLLVVEDVTDAHLLSEQSERGRRLASMGEMAARIAHEIRNPLTACRLFLEMASQDVREGETGPALGNLGKLEGVLGAIECTVANMLGFIRSHRPSRVPFDPEGLVRECLDYVRPACAERNVAVRIANELPDPTAVSDPGLLRQVFLNLLLNAAQAAPASGGLVEIGISLRQVRARGVTAPYLRFTFRDNGKGIPEAEIPRIFDPFFTTRQEGTGLGLTVVQSILTALGGFAEVSSRPGTGTTFSVLVPQHPPKGSP